MSDPMKRGHGLVLRRVNHEQAQDNYRVMYGDAEVGSIGLQRGPLTYVLILTCPVFLDSDRFDPFAPSRGSHVYPSALV